MTKQSEQTIYALSTAPGKAGVAIIRVSGPRALNSLCALCSFDKNPTPRVAYFKKIIDPSTNETIDQALILYFKNPHSFTGEDCAEYHIHGGKAIINRMLDVLSAQDDHRMAEAGEFTRRAFDNDKIDLTQAEAIADLIDAQTTVQHKQAIIQADGKLSALYASWRTQMIKVLAFSEAHLDFPDEDDIPDTLTPEIENMITTLTHDLRDHLNDNHRGERLRDGIKIAIIGAPNAGKSTLLNTLAKREVAIVSPIKGTTRDVLELPMDIKGYPVILYDTAGIREIGTDDNSVIEGEGIKRALSKASTADLILHMIDSTDPTHLDINDALEPKTMTVYNKAEGTLGVKEKGIYISALSEDGIKPLLDTLITHIDGLYALREQPSLTRARHREFLNKSLSCLENATSEHALELLSENLRQAAFYICKITGHIDVEDLLDVIFGEFCVGK